MSDFTTVQLSITIGLLAAIVYSLRIQVINERRIRKIMKHMGISE